MNRLNTRILIIATIVILVILIVISFIYVSNKGKIQVPGTSTSIEIAPSPTPIPPKIIITPVFTGANEYIPPSTLNAAQQKQTLKKKTPLIIDGFTITYDFGSDLFIVTLSEPKATSKTSFQQWLQNNYPTIPINKFVFK